jgi:enamine deaminase RidA (YjgF/YER057c/UK114 family)
LKKTSSVLPQIAAFSEEWAARRIGYFSVRNDGVSARSLALRIECANRDRWRKIDFDVQHGAKPARSMVHFGADIPGVLVAIDAIALA